MKINTYTWGTFKYSKIFEIKKGFYNKKPEHIKAGNIPFLGATDKNNGVTEYYSLYDLKKASKTGDEKNAPLEDKIFPRNALCVTNNGAPGYVYYQDREFTCSHDVNPLYLKKGEFNRYIAMFVATVIEQDRYRWQYGRKWRPSRMKNSKIKLPQDKNGNPDWEYMEQYIRNLHSTVIKTKVKPGSLKLCEHDWGTFKLKDLFDPVYGVNLELSNLKKVNQDDPDSVAFVSRIEGNNGVSACVKRIKEIKPQPANILTVAAGGSVLSTYLQSQEFYSGRDLYLLYEKTPMSKYVKLFIKTVIEANKYRYNYGRQANKTLAEIELKLPINEKGQLDKDFMENYIRSLPYSDKI